MSGKSSFAKATLPYPLWSACWDPYRSSYLVVGGGGGQNTGGVANKITLLDVSSPAEIIQSGEIDLSRSEDSVQSLAALASRDGLIAYAGINSSEEEQKAGKNDHFRAFEIRYPQKRKSSKTKQTTDTASKGDISFLSKTSLFDSPATPKPETFQRLLRLSPAQKRASGSKRIGAVATDLSKQNEIIVFNATTSSPSSADIIQRIRPDENQRANGLDIIESPSKEGDFTVAYCTNHGVYVSPVSYDFTKRKTTSKLNAPWKIYDFPFPDVFEGKKGRPTVRELRWLTPSHLLLLANLPNKSGAELLILHLYTPEGPGNVTFKKRLPSHIKACVDLDVCTLDADPVTGARQIAVAVAGNDISICVLAIDYYGTKSNALGPFRVVNTYRDVHPASITSIAWSPFHSPYLVPESPPKSGSSSPNSKKKKGKRSPEPVRKQVVDPGPQYLRLASTSMGNTIVVDTFTLDAISTTAEPGSKSKPNPRHILLSSSSALLNSVSSVLLLGFGFLMALVVLQSFLDYQYANEEGGGLTIFPDSVRRIVGLGSRSGGVWEGSVLQNAPQAVASPLVETHHKLQDLLHHIIPSHHSSSDPKAKDKAIILRANPEEGTGMEISTELHHTTPEEVVKREDAKRWEQLSESEKSVWRQRVSKAGKWGVEEVETVLKGVLFSEYAGAVGRIVGEAIAGGM
ncbi:hypothetical protein K402DRAFT_396633 [Aulographum hederae CBS 113979]|uniref:Guanine nucleotide-exchange factor SEC12 n=1 Tax=Aulographum hederae CBS 113979 TaxID=1176131 RepID=A0A6G1GRF8_9PEZI|nr:hypothetical protein K402DRAFT_396633 [Aulographum hederae CBS 113979]